MADIKSEKLALIHDILAVEDEKLLLLVRRLIESASKTKEFPPPEDFWQDLPAKQKADILEAIRQIEAGEGVPHASVIDEFKQRYAK
jgi:hypothetical protein